MQELKLLKIHKRRLGLLKEKRAKVGTQAEASVDMEIEDIQGEISTIETSLKRRLQALREKAAVYGLNSDPSVSIEIEDIEGYFNN